MSYIIEPYETESGNVPLKKFLSELAESGNLKETAVIQLFLGRLETFGLKMNMHFPDSIKKLRGEIFELRPGGSRILFFSISSEYKFILLHGFKKKSQKTPQKEIDRAEQELKDYKRRCMK